MLYINDQRTIEGVPVYGDDKKSNVFYIFPETPRISLLEDGKPFFSLLKYRNPIDRGAGKVGGGFLTIAIEFTIEASKLEVIKEKLQEEVNKIAERNKTKPIPEVLIQSITFNKGTSKITILDEESSFVENLWGGIPSLFGKNRSIFSAELTPQGAAFFEGALKGGKAILSAQYFLFFDAMLPPLTVEASFSASSFYSFVQEIDVTERICSEDEYKETLTEIMVKSESTNFELIKGNSKISDDVVDQVRTWATSKMDDAVERLMIEALPVEDPESARKWYKENDIEDVKREVVRNSISNYNFSYTENQAFEFDRNPVGPINFVDADGNQVDLDDFIQEIDLNDDFFKEINVTVSVNAPFDELPIHSVEVKLMYKGEPMDVIGSAIDGEFQFINADAVAHFACFIQDDDFDYSYSYQVNYKGAGKIFQSEEITTNESVLTINADDAGILSVDISPGDVDFEQIKQVQITMEYEDSSNGVDKITDQFIMDKDASEHKFEHIIFSKRSKPYRYKLNYKMSSGKEFESDWAEGNSKRLFINDPFTQSKTVGFRASGNLTEEIANIFIEATYKDEANDYVLTQSMALSKDNPFFDWMIPLVDGSVNKITYKGHIVRNDGTQEEIPETVSDASIIIVGENVEDLMDITIMADLLDFTIVKLAHVQLQYVDEENNINEREAFSFKEGALEHVTWSVKLKDKTRDSYSWSATFFMQDGTREITEPIETNELTIFLEVPSIEIPSN